MRKKNHLAVLLPHFNNENGLKVTLESLKRESCDFDLYLMDDGSTYPEKIRELVGRYQLGGMSIHLIFNKVNEGVTATLNRGIEKILSIDSYEYLARIDAGDVNIGERFRDQTTFLSEHSDIGLVSSYVKFVDMKRKELFVFKPPQTARELRKVIHVYNPFIHPATMIRISVIREIGLYPDQYPALEDHAYFIKILRKTNANIIDKIHLEYEINPMGVSLSKRGIQTKSRLKLFKDNYYLGIYPTYGIIRALLTYIAPRSLLFFLKKRFYK